MNQQQMILKQQPMKLKLIRKLKLIHKLRQQPMKLKLIRKLKQ
jgi:hypothetical protein